MTERMKERVFRGGENGQRDKMAVAAKLDYEFAPSSYFGKDTIFVKRIQLFDTWLWKKFVAQFRIYGVDDKKAERYHNGWRSEYWGKMMRGAALVCAYSQDDDLYEILTASVKDLLTTQDEKGRITTYSLEYEFNGDFYATDTGIARDVTITSLELASVTENLGSRSQELLARRVEKAEDVSQIYDENNEYREDFVMTVLFDAAYQSLKEDARMTRQRVTLNLVFRQGEWWVLPDSALLSAISGGTAG